MYILIIHIHLQQNIYTNVTFWNSELNCRWFALFISNSYNLILSSIKPYFHSNCINFNFFFSSFLLQVSLIKFLYTHIAFVCFFFLYHHITVVCERHTIIGIPLLNYNLFERKKKEEKIEKIDLMKQHIAQDDSKNRHFFFSSHVIPFYSNKFRESDVRLCSNMLILKSTDEENKKRE